MEPHWHTYWRYPGDTGLTTKLDWSLPRGFEHGKINWPYPDVFVIGGLANFGYENEVFLLVEIIPPEVINENEITLELNGEWLVCKEECVPESAKLNLTLTVKSEIPLLNNDWLTAFAQTRDRLPIKDQSWEFSSNTTDSSVILEASYPEWFSGKMTSARFFPYKGGYFSNVAEQKLNKTENGFTLEILLENFREGDPQKIEGILFSESGWRGEGSEKALEINVAIGDSQSKMVQSNSEVSGILIALAFAFVGGLILNLMPCVLPVLSIKILGFVEQSANDKKEIIMHGILFTAGVVISFWVLAGLLLVLRAGGEELGWGFQLQSPIFIMILSILLFVFGLNLFGVFEVGNSLMSIGNKVASSGKTGAFLSGVTATVLATPCTAPFMGSALGFALTQPAISTILIFTFLGFGIAFPYLILSMFPRWLEFLPKPGNWMNNLKQFMGFLLFATIIWLAWVLGIQSGSDSIIGLLIALLFSGMAAWIYGKWANIIQKRLTRLIASIIALALLLGGTITGLNLIGDHTDSNSLSKKLSDGLQWQDYSPQLVEDLLSEGSPVFIDFTAAWCLSCQVNERIAFTDDDVIKEFAQKNITAIKADWTNRDEEITKALAEFGRNSVPLYVYYEQGNSSEPVILPEILTPEIVINYINNK